MKCLFLLLVLFAATASPNNEDNSLGMNKAAPAASCHEIYQHNPTSSGIVGQY